jgi:hypothetical protein
MMVLSDTATIIDVLTSNMAWAGTVGDLSRYDWPLTTPVI